MSPLPTLHQRTDAGGKKGYPSLSLYHLETTHVIYRLT